MVLGAPIFRLPNSTTAFFYCIGGIGYHQMQYTMHIIRLVRLGLIYDVWFHFYTGYNAIRRLVMSGKPLIQLILLFDFAGDTQSKRSLNWLN